jgi:hypothetical protein
MNFYEGEFYMHRHSLDIIVRVVKVLDQTEDTANLVVEQWNMGYAGRPWRVCDETLGLRIGKGYKPDWQRIPVWQLVQARENVGLPRGIKL